MVLVTRGGVGIGRPTADAFLVRRRERHLTGRVLGPLQEFGSLIAVSSVSVLAARSGLGGPQRD